MQTKRRNGFVIMSHLIVLLGSFIYVLLLAIVNGSIGQILAMGVTIFGSFGIAKTINPVVITMPWWLIITLTITCGVLRGILKYIEQYSNHYIAFKILAILRDKIFARLRILAPARLEGKKKGSIVSLITADIETLEVFYAHTVSPIFIALISCITVTLFVGIYTSWYLAIVAVIFYILIGIVSPLITSKLLSNTGVSYRAKFSDFNAYFMDSIKGVKDILLHNKQEMRMNEVNKKSTELLKETKTLKHKTSYSSAITESFITIGIFVSLLISIILFENNMLDLSLAVIGVVSISSSFGPVVSLAALPSNLTQTFASGDRVINLLKEEPEVYDVVDGKDFDFEKLEVKDLSFKYKDDDNQVLNNINLDGSRGQIIGIVGKSGCGKSTLLNLLLRFYQKNNGTINYNNIDIDSINTNSLHKNVTMVSQSTYLFSDTIRENMKIAKEDATDEEIYQALKFASLDEFVLKLPEKLDTKVSETWDNISAGEKQRLGLARAFLSGSKVILLDEPTSNIDSINEGIILKALKDYKKDRLIILVSHRESTMAIADKIYHIENGAITSVE